MYKLFKPLTSPLIVASRSLHLPSLIDRFPKNVLFTFAYGSGALKQANTDHESFKNNMLDIILVVDDLQKFHQKNLSKNSKDYSLTNRLLFNAQNIAEIQKNKGNRTWFHPFVRDALPNGQLLKYGIVEFSDFEHDMVNWSDLYLSGRLHKPVKKYFPKSNDSNDKNIEIRERIENLIKMNRQQALNAALLLLAEDLSESELYEKIASLSYTGDIRNQGFENPNKVSNIVAGQFDEFKMIYRPLLEEYDTARLELQFDDDKVLLEGKLDEPQVIDGKYGLEAELDRISEDPNHVFQDLSAVTILNKLNACPLNLQIQIAKIAGKNDRQRRDVEEVLRTVARHPIPSDFVEKGLRNIVSKKSKDQAILAAIGAGPKKGIVYAIEKLKKGMQKK